MDQYSFNNKSVKLVIAFLLIAAFFTACVPLKSELGNNESIYARLETDEGIYFGVNLDWEHESPSAFNDSLGKHAAVFVKFCSFPLPTDEEKYLDDAVAMVAEQGGMMMITLEPWGGLQTVTPDSVNQLVEKIAAYEEMGVHIFVRFAHEMNGSWYPWSQQPTDYIDAFQMIANALHEKSPQSAMVWAPNYGGGYPFSGGVYEIKTDHPDFELVDTNEDGLLDMADNPYNPYYPGDDAVDWVGVSLYHWGNAYPWGENEVPEEGKFIAQLTGTYNGLNGDETLVPDFYTEYYLGHNKPIAIPETAAFYATDRSGSGELEIKQAWWRQVLDRDLLSAYAGIKMINWFEWQKPESEIGGDIIDWRVLGSQAIADQFINDLPTDILVFAE